eukprot:IDg1699t1
MAVYRPGTLARRIFAAVDAVVKGYTYRNAASIYRIPRFTFSDRVAFMRTNEISAHLAAQMGRQKRNTLLSTCDAHYYDDYRHCARLPFPVSSDIVTTHFAKFERLMSENSLNSYRVYNFDETRGSPIRYIAGLKFEKRIMRRHGDADIKKVEFGRADGFTCILCINAAGDVYPTMFLFKGITLLYQQIFNNGQIVLETYYSFLPSGAVMVMRDDNGAADGDNFLSLGLFFIEIVMELTASDVKSNTDRSIASVEDLKNMRMQKRVLACERILGASAELLSSGFVDTTNSVVLSEEAAMNATRANAKRDSEKKRKDQLRAAEIELLQAQ